MVQVSLRSNISYCDTTIIRIALISNCGYPRDLLSLGFVVGLRVLTTSY